MRIDLSKDPYAHLREIEFLQSCIDHVNEPYFVATKPCTDIWCDFQEVVLYPRKDSITKNGKSITAIRMLVFFVEQTKGIIPKDMNLLLRTRIELTYADGTQGIYAFPFKSSTDLEIGALAIDFYQALLLQGATVEVCYFIKNAPMKEDVYDKPAKRLYSTELSKYYQKVHHKLAAKSSKYLHTLEVKEPIDLVFAGTGEGDDIRIFFAKLVSEGFKVNRAFGFDRIKDIIEKVAKQNPHNGIIQFEAYKMDEYLQKLKQQPKESKDSKENEKSYRMIVSCGFLVRQILSGTKEVFRYLQELSRHFRLIILSAGRTVELTNVAMGSAIGLKTQFDELFDITTGDTSRTVRNIYYLRQPSEEEQLNILKERVDIEAGMLDLSLLGDPLLYLKLYIQHCHSQLDQIKSIDICFSNLHEDEVEEFARLLQNSFLKLQNIFHLNRNEDKFLMPLMRAMISLNSASHKFLKLSQLGDAPGTPDTEMPLLSGPRLRRYKKADLPPKAGKDEKAVAVKSIVTEGITQVGAPITALPGMDRASEDEMKNLFGDAADALSPFITVYSKNNADKKNMETRAITKLSVSGTGSPLTAAGDTKQVFVTQMESRLGEYIKVPALAQFVDILKSGNYGKALRTICGIKPSSLEVQKKVLEAIELLLSKVKVDDRFTENGPTPLYCAAQNKNRAICTLLIQNGAEIDALVNGKPITSNWPDLTSIKASLTCKR